jgi:hypothetical protein
MKVRIISLLAKRFEVGNELNGYILYVRHETSSGPMETDFVLVNIQK